MSEGDPGTVPPIDRPRRVPGGRDRPPGPDREPRKQPSGAAKRRAAAERAKAGGTLPSLRDELTVTYTLAAQFWAMRDPFCGGTALAQVPAIVDAWDTWAQSSPGVHRVLSQLLAASGPIAVASAHLPLVVAIMQHHGPGNRPPDGGMPNAAPPPAATGPVGDIDGNGYDGEGVFWGIPTEPAAAA